MNRRASFNLQADESLHDARLVFYGPGLQSLPTQASGIFSPEVQGLNPIHPVLLIAVGHLLVENFL